MPPRKTTKLDDLSTLVATTEQGDAANQLPFDPGIFPQMDQIPPEPTIKPILNPFLTQAAGAQVPFRSETAPPLSDEIASRIIMAGLRVKWSINHWVLLLANASTIVANVGGARERFQTGVPYNAPLSIWNHEIAQLVEVRERRERASFNQKQTNVMGQR